MYDCLVLLIKKVTKIKWSHNLTLSATTSCLFDFPLGLILILLQFLVLFLLGLAGSYGHLIGLALISLLLESPFLLIFADEVGVVLIILGGPIEIEPNLIGQLHELNKQGLFTLATDGLLAITLNNSIPISNILVLLSHIIVLLNLLIKGMRLVPQHLHIFQTGRLLVGIPNIFLVLSNPLPQLFAVLIVLGGTVSVELVDGLLLHFWQEFVQLLLLFGLVVAEV